MVDGDAVFAGASAFHAGCESFARQLNMKGAVDNDVVFVGRLDLLDTTREAGVDEAACVAVCCYAAFEHGDDGMGRYEFFPIYERPCFLTEWSVCCYFLSDNVSSVHQE